MSLDATAAPERRPAGSLSTQRALTLTERRGFGLLVILLVAMAAISWRRWGNPELDAGLDMTAADRLLHGLLPYRDLRYYYGPLGLFGLAGSFAVLGSTLTAAYAYGLAIFAGILAVFHRLARHWLDLPMAMLATALLAAIGFSGTVFNFVLPHTNAATVGLLVLLGEVLMLVRGRWAWAGVLIGTAALTRPEFLGFAAAAAGGALLGRVRDAGWRSLAAPLLALVLPAIAIGGGVLVGFAAAAGWHRLFLEDLFPVDFQRLVGNRFEANWAPLDPIGMVGLVARAGVYLSLVGGLGVACVRWRSAGPRWRAAMPVLAAGAGLLLVDAVARVLSAFPGTRAMVESEVKRLVLPMSWLPAAAFAVLAWAAWWWWRRERSVLLGGWVADGALIAAAAACSLRAYNLFTTDIYATYYAALPLLIGVVLHARAARRWPLARPAVVFALAMSVVALQARAYVIGWRHEHTVLRTARGRYLANDQAGSALQSTIDALRARTPPGAGIVAMPEETGLYFLADRPPALRDLVFLPGDVLGPGAEDAAARGLARAQAVIVGARSFDQYGFRAIGVDYDQRLLAAVRRTFPLRLDFGDVGRPLPRSQPAQAFSVYLRR